MGFRGHLTSFIGTTFKYIFCNRKRKSFKEIHLDGAFGNDFWSDYSPANATLGTIIIIVLFLIYLAMSRFLGFG